MNNKEYQKQWRLNNKEYLKEKNRLRYLNNKERILQQTGTYQKTNKDKVNLYNRLRYAKGIGVERKKRERFKYRERESNYQKAYCKTSHGILVAKINNAKRRAKKKFTQDGTVTKQFIEGLFIVQDYKCNLCGCDITIKYHIDHIYPLSKGGLHTANNIQLLCKHCNLSKGNKISS